jgi:hypothetical protein
MGRLPDITRVHKTSDVTHCGTGEALDREPLVDLVLTIRFYSAVVRVLATLDIRVEPDYQSHLDKISFPTGA